jgi:tRNA threonylcarbamoyladenosine biosynthesis protein TsaE
MIAPEETHIEKHTCSSEEETLALGERLAQELSAGDMVCIAGDLGAGKTVLCRGIAAGLGVDPSDVRSPTFAIAHEYRGAVEVLHFDCYRISKPEEVLQIGWDDYLQRPAVILIEWPENIEPLLQEESFTGKFLWIDIGAAGSNRELTVTRKI